MFLKMAWNVGAKAGVVMRFQMAFGILTPKNSNEEARSSMEALAGVPDMARDARRLMVLIMFADLLAAPMSSS